MRVPIRSEAAAYLYFERLRWGGDAFACPHCAEVGRAYFLQPAGGDTRATRTGATSARRVWKCGACRRQFSVLSGTVFEGTRIPLTVWAAVVADLVAGRTVTPTELANRHSITGHSARHVLARLSAAGLPTDPVSSGDPRAGRG